MGHPKSVPGQSNNRLTLCGMSKLLDRISYSHNWLLITFPTTMPTPREQPPNQSLRLSCYFVSNESLVDEEVPIWPWLERGSLFLSFLLLMVLLQNEKTTRNYQELENDTTTTPSSTSSPTSSSTSTTTDNGMVG